MRGLACLVLVVGCVGSTPVPSSDDGTGPEIDGEYLNAEQGDCFGGVGGQTRCSGSHCENLDEPTCGGASGCFIAYEENPGARTFRRCLPVAAVPIVAGPCSTLDALGCATREDCSAIYTATYVSSFVTCESDVFSLRAGAR